ncbi:Protein HIR2 [Candida viswanathii]|uniref:Protein HIR n=1 Tax=Candida viswanathii TaxID=5486 RepID=A0A367YJH4_9ASCO|nr:Protein HIR2 [Candida viswanathii]
MKLLKLPQVFHNGEIHTIDINTDSSYLVSAGKDNKVSVWHLAQLIDLSKAVSSANATSELKKQMKAFAPFESIECHEHLINVVKFLPGKLNEFVSSDVKGNVFHHVLDDKPTTKQIFPFKNDDIEAEPLVDLSVSADNRLVAWSTKDGKVYLYDLAKDTFQELTTIYHEKPIIQRSIAFDPTNNYLITVGDDTQINLYQYNYDKDADNYTFRLINKISRYFSQNPLSVRYKRISWSPEGELIPIPTATKNQTMLISLISRTAKWGNAENLVGHNHANEVVRFSPKIFSETDKSTNRTHNIVASGGSDKTIAIWNTTKTSPITILEGLIQGEVLDMAWTKDGESLLFGTSKGHVGIVNFERGELGYPFSDETMERMIKLHANLVESMLFRYPYEQTVGNRKQLPSIEFLKQSDAILALGPSSKDIKDEPTEDGDKSKKGPETTTGGEIVPEVIPPPQLEEIPDPKTNDLLDSVMSTRVDSSAKAVKSSTKEEKSKTPPIEETQKETPEDKKSETADESKKSELQDPPKLEKAEETKKPEPESPKKPSFNKQKVTTKNGKRRIQPMLISSNNGAAAPNIPKPAPTTTTIKSASRAPMEFDKPSYSVSEEFYKQNKRPRTDEANGTVKKVKREMEPVKFIGSVILNPNTSFSKIRLATPKVKFGFQVKSQFDGDSNFLDVRNGSGNETKPSRITYFKKDKEIWCDFIPKYIQLAVEGSNFWAVTIDDGTILTYSRVSGKRLLPSIVLGSPASFFESYNNYLMAVTCVGEVYVWDMELKKSVLKCSIGPLLELCNKDGLVKSENITLCAVTSLGIPLVTLSNGSGYLYNKNLGVWQTITESWWSFGSYYWDGVDETAKPQSMNMFNDEQSIISLLEHKTNEEILRKSRTGRGKFFNKISKNMLMKEGFESLENTISISHLENKILCCELLGEDKDFHKFFTSYVQRICELGFKAKLYEVCDQLLGPIDDPENKDWDPKICGMDKRELLKEIITLCSQFRDAQRVLIHFGEKIGIVNNDI